MPPSSRRGESLAGRLVRLGFSDTDATERALTSPVLAPLVDQLGLEPLAEWLAEAADPDRAALALEAGIGRCTPEQRDALVARVTHDDALRARLVAVLGASQALADHLARHPEHLEDLVGDLAVDDRDPRDELLESVGAQPSSPAPRAALTGDGARLALRVAYRRRLLRIAARDLTGEAELGLITRELSDLADAVLETALAVSRAEAPADAAPCRLAVIAMGKCGGQELNYVSDVDVMFVAEPVDGATETAALASATRLATGLMQVCSASTPEGVIWPVDPNLRPEGRQGALVRTPASYAAYYDRWASTWEFQALLKARVVAGDRALGEAFVDAVAPYVWAAAGRDRFVEDTQAMRRRVEEHIPQRDADRQVKLGRGGLRDVEFSVQLLQLVHGRSDVFVRSPTTLIGLEQLSTRGYVGRDDAAELDRAYRFLRALEHRLQLDRLTRRHVLPTEEPELRRLARSLGLRESPVDQLQEEWRRHSVEVRRIHEKLFYRPLLNAVARLPAEEARLSTAAAEERLEALGFADPRRALEHIQALTSGLSRRAAIQQTLLPVMLGWFAETPDPDAGLLGFRQVSDTLGATPWYLRALRDEGVTAERLARLLSTSRWARDLLLRAPDAVKLLGDDAELEPRSLESLTSEMLAAARRQDDPMAAIASVRASRRRELFRIAVTDLLGRLDVTTVGEALSDVTIATLRAGLLVAVRSIEAERRGPLPTRLLIVGMGRLGGHETGYGSDADVLFVHDPLPDADEQDAQHAAHAVAEELRRMLAIPSTDPPLAIDANLRPEGRQGPLVRSLASYAAYYARWSLGWEAQALLRADPVAGDPELAAAFVELIDPIRYPESGLDDAEVREIRRIKARVEAERLPRGADPTLHPKLGRGGLADVEWVAQLLQLRHAHDEPGLRTTRTVAALRAAVEAQLLDPTDAALLVHAWETATNVRNAIVQVVGRPADTLPSDVRALAAVARLLGYAPGRTGDLEEDYRRTSRRARAVVERVFYN